MTERPIGEYVIRQLLGRGGRAEVWDGYDPDLDRRVAIRIILPHLSSDPAFGNRFRREAKLIASLRHQHIVQLYDFDIVDGQAIMVMEYLPGGTLRGRLDLHRDNKQLMPLEIVEAYLNPVAAALDYAHAHKAIHRDLKPSNILFSAEDKPVIGDFGISKIVGESSDITAISEIFGTPAYMSPEQASGGEVNSHSDIYSLGVMLYEQVTGRVPFVADTPADVLMQHLSSSPPKPSQFNPELSPAIDAVILRAMEKEPGARFSTAADLARAFSESVRAGVDLVPIAVIPCASYSESKSGGDGESTVPVEPDAPALNAPIGAVATESTQPTGTRLLVQATKAAALAAPLVGYDAPDVENLPRDRRSMFTALLAAVGIFFAALQFAFEVFDLVERWTLPLVDFMPYLASGLLISGAVLSCLILLRASTRSQRSQAGTLLAVIVVAGVAWGSWWAYRELRTDRNFVILIGDFDPKRSAKWIDFAEHIAVRLRAELSEIGDAVEIRQAREVFPDAETALERGAEQHATVVIWGTYSDSYASPHLAVLQFPDLNPGLDGSRILMRAASFAPIPGLRLADSSAITRHLSLCRRAGNFTRRNAL